MLSIRSTNRAVTDKTRFFDKRGTWVFAFFIATLLIAATQARADINPADRELAERVFQQIISSAPVPSKMEWPPKLEILDTGEVNAFATIRVKDGKKYPVVVCYEGLIKRDSEGNADRLAYVLGHEIAHHLLGHTTTGSEATEFVRATFSRDQEITADRRGMELALRANYSYQGGLSAIRKMIDLGLNYSSFEGLAADHPSWLDRIALLDKDQAGLWRSMSAFDNGVYFLLVQNYALAERAFRQVTKDFPGAYEAWANLGYALLMQYADSLDTEDLKRFDVGQIVVGGFYRRPQSLESRVRGINEEMWWDAVGALREAIRLKPELSLPKANLGIAYLFRPAGKDAGKATQLLEEATQLARTDATLDPLSRLTVELNLVVAHASEGSSEEALLALTRIEASLKQGQQSSVSTSASVLSAISYNKAVLLAQSPANDRQRLAIGELENYLRHTSSSLAWWPLAYRRYSTLCQQFGLQPKSQNTLLSQSASTFRPIASSGQIALGETLLDAKRQLGGTGVISSLIRGTNLIGISYPDRGLKLVATDEVLAIVLYGDKAPRLPVREMGLGTKERELRIGMSSADLDAVLGDSDYDFRQLVDPEQNYRFYSDLGLAVLVQNGKIVELVVGQIPKRKVGI